MFDDTRAVTHQSAISWEVAPIVNRGYRMAGGESDEFFASAIEQCVICHKECVCLLGNKHCKGRFEIVFGPGSKDMNLESKALSRSIHIFRGWLSRGVVGVDQQCDYDG